MMLFVELYTPRGAFNAQQRERLARRLVRFVGEEEHSRAVLEDSRALTQVVVLEPETWVVGDHNVTPQRCARYVARVSAPAPWVKLTREEIVHRFTWLIVDAAREAAPDVEPQVWVEVRGVRDGSWGLDGRTLSTSDIERVITRRRRAAVQGQGPVPGPHPGTVHDPICDMVVDLYDAAITLEHAGETYAYCTQGCRTQHAAELGATG